MVKAIVMKFRRPLIVGFHIVLIALANYLAFWIRFDGTIPAEGMALLVKMLPWLILIRGLMFVPLQLYKGLWRYTGIWDLRNVIIGVLGSTMVFYVVVHWGYGLRSYPLSIFIIDSLVLIFFLGGEGFRNFSRSSILYYFFTLFYLLCHKSPPVSPDEKSGRIGSLAFCLCINSP